MFYVTNGNGEKNRFKIKNSAFGFIGWKMEIVFMH